MSCSVALPHGDCQPWVGLQCVIVVFPDYTHFLDIIDWVYTVAWFPATRRCLWKMPMCIQLVYIRSHFVRMVDMRRCLAP